jgi:hypothetical protein
MWLQAVRSKSVLAQVFVLGRDPCPSARVLAPSQVTLSFSGDSNVYHLAGASWFGGNFTDAQSDLTETEFFQILGASGGPRGQRLGPHALHDERER